MSEGFMSVGAPDTDSEAVILGASLATVYPDRHPHATGGPAALRAASQRLACLGGHHDFDTGQPFASWRSRIADGGDVNVVRADAEGNRRRITTVVQSVVASGAMPVLLGGDDSLAEPFVASWRDHGPVSVVHIDAHLDFRDEVMGEAHGYNSPMRRASEMEWVRRVIHVGQRGVGSARPSDVQDSLDAGNVIVTAKELERAGVPAVGERLGAGERFVVVYDVAGTDPADVPTVHAPAPGGPGVEMVAEIIAALAARGSLEGLVVTEFEPELDDDSARGALGVVRIICRALDGRLT